MYLYIAEWVSVEVLLLLSLIWWENTDATTQKYLFINIGIPKGEREKKENKPKLRFCDAIEKIWDKNISAQEEAIKLIQIFL